MKYSIILILSLLLVGCIEQQDCDNECKYKTGDLVTFRLNKGRQFIISDVNNNRCACKYDGHYFDDTGERQYSSYVNEGELESVEGEVYDEVNNVDDF